MTTVELRAPSALSVHPINAEIYGDGADGELVESVREKGILTPLLVTRGGMVISGHRRLDAARKVRLTEVPVIFFDSTDELDIKEALVESNRQRGKTPEQVGREFKLRKAIRHERESRQGQRNGTSSKSLDEVRQKPAIAAAADLGVSNVTAYKAEAVVDAIDHLKANGKVREAEQLRSTLNGRSITRAYEEAREAGLVTTQTRARPTRDVITLAQWRTLPESERHEALARSTSSAKFNWQSENNIEWALWSWNPVTGCLHNCSYCYARDIAERFYQQKFAPSFVPDQLCAPANTKVPVEAVTQIGYKNVFTCSMADLFGKWVPTEWIEAVLGTVAANPQWNFLFLTKFPGRLTEFTFPPNAWVGATVDAQARIPIVEKAFASVEAHVKWLSCEPLLEPLKFRRLDLFQWIVVGGASKSTETPDFRPPRRWVVDLEQQAADAGCRIYEKTNLLERVREYPGAESPDHIDVPRAFKLGYLQRDIRDWQTYSREVSAPIIA